MSGKRRYATFTQTVAPNDTIELAVSGTYYRALSASFEFDIAIDEEPFSKLQGGLGFSVPEFKKVRIKNPSGANNLVVEMAFGMGEIHDSRSTSVGNLNVKSGDTLEGHITGTVGTTAVQITTADTSTTRQWVCNNSANVIYIGHSNAVTTSNGFPIEAGARINFDTGAAIWAIAAAGSNNVRALLEKGA